MSEAIMALVRAASDRVEARTGYKAFHYAASPTPSTTKYVFGHTQVRSPEEALATMAAVESMVKDGTWDRWNCRSCAWSFTTEAARDEHERGPGHS